MSDNKESYKHTTSTEIPAEITLGLFDLLKSLRESVAGLLNKHLDNETARLRIRELQVQIEIQRERDKKPNNKVIRSRRKE
jgi:hypothetical protein